MQVLLFKIASVVAIVSILQWIAVYTYLEHTWWKGPVGRSLVEFAVYAMVTPALFILSLFLHLNRGDSQVLAWAEIILRGVTAVLFLSARVKVTPVADPKNAEGVTLVPSIGDVTGVTGEPPTG